VLNSDIEIYLQLKNRDLNSEIDQHRYFENVREVYGTSSDKGEFWKKIEERIELVEDILRTRFKTLTYFSYFNKCVDCQTTEFGIERRAHFCASGVFG